jgi:hypothetical protein
MNGDFIWAKKIGGYNFQSYTIPTSVDSDSLNNVYLSGYYFGTADFDPGPLTNNFTCSPGATNAFICKLDSNGNFAWNRVIEASINNQTQAFSLDVDSKNNILVAGGFQNSVTFNDSLSIYTFTSSTSNGFILKLNPSGNFIWEKEFVPIWGGSGIKSLTLDNYENILVSGAFGGTVDFNPGIVSSTLTCGTIYGGAFVTKLDSTGSFIWAKKIVGTNIVDNFNCE